MDANSVTAIATSAMAVIALVTAVIFIWQTRFATRVQVLLKCDSSWTCDLMRATRRRAASSLLAGKPGSDVDTVLDFFETVAGLFVKPHGPFRLRVLPDRWARHTFYWHAACYWTKSRDYIDTVRQRQSERTAWEDLCGLMPRWIAVEGGPPTPKDIEAFLVDEARA